MGAWKDDTWVTPYIKRHLGMLVLAIALTVVAGLFACALMFTSGYMISLAAAIPLTVLALHIPSLFVRIFGIGKPLLDYAERLTSHEWILKMTSEMRRKLYLVLESRSASLETEIEKTTFGQILATLTDDVGHVQNLILRSILPLLSAWVTCVICVAAAGVLSWQLMLILAISLVVIALVIPIASALWCKARIELIEGTQRRIYNGMTDDIFGITDWILSGRKQDYMCRMDGLLERKAHATATLKRIERSMNVAAQIVFALCAAAIIIWAYMSFCTGDITGAALSALSGMGNENAPAYPPNWVAAFALCLFPLMEMLTPLSESSIAYTKQIGSLKNLNRYKEAAPTESFELETPEINDKPDIEMNGVWTGYDGPDVICGLTLKIPYGKKVAVTGRSGCGKTTLAKIIAGELAAQRGKVAVGGANPAVVGDMWRIVGVATQQPKLFNMTIRENLKIANPDATDEAMISALESVGLRKRFETLPHGLNSTVEEGAFNFSGGEAHRLALARLLLSDQPIVIFDEPFVALDADTERRVLQTMVEAFEGKTLIVITHSESSLEAFDEVISLESCKA